MLSVSKASLPPELAAALKDFHTEGAPGWSFTQRTVSAKRQLLERFEAEKPPASRWQLLEKDGRAPTPDELKDYETQLGQHPRTETAPNIRDQFDPDSCTLVQSDADSRLYRFKLRQGDGADRSAAYMTVTLTFHQPTHTITRFELTNTEPFSPMLMVKVNEVRTVIDYSLPEAGRPSLLRQISVKVRGRALLFRSLDEDMAVTYSDFQPPSSSPAKPVQP